MWLPPAWSATTSLPGDPVHNYHRHFDFYVESFLKRPAVGPFFPRLNRRCRDLRCERPVDAVIGPLF